MMSSERPDLHRFAFWIILTFAAVVRLKGLSSGLPLHTLYGENDTLLVLQRMLLHRESGSGTIYLSGPFLLYSFALFCTLFIGLEFGADISMKLLQSRSPL